MFELFDSSRPNDLAGRTLRFNGTSEFSDEWAGPNNAVEFARPVTLPFNTKDASRYTEIDPAGADVDYFRFHANAGDYLVARVIGGRRESGALLDSMLGLFRIHTSAGRVTGTLLTFDDDSGPGVWSLVVYPVRRRGAGRIGLGPGAGDAENTLQGGRRRHKSVLNFVLFFGMMALLDGPGRIR